MYVQLTQFAPDADPTQGSLVYCENVIGTPRGYRGAPTPSSTGVAALASACLGAALVKNIEGQATLYAGTGTKLYKLGTTTWDDVTRTSGGDYSTTYRWRFAQFGNDTVAVSRGVNTQRFASGGTDFADLSGAPKARVCFSVGDFIFLLGTNEATYGDQADRWWCSAYLDVTDWTPAIATQCTTGRLLDTPGPLTAGIKLGEYAVVFKAKAIYVGAYAGPPVVWDFARITDTIGAVSHECVQNIGQALLFCDVDGFYQFDGSSVQSISNGKISDWYKSKLDADNAQKICSMQARDSKTVYWFFPVSGGDGSLSAWISYHWPTGKFGYGTQSIEVTVDYAPAAMDYDAFGARYSTYADLPDVTFESSLFQSGSDVPAVFNASHVICTLDGATGSASITTGDIGQDGAITLMKRVRNRYLDAPDSATLTNYYSDQVGTSYTQDVTTTEQSGKFDLLRSARWHKIKLDTTGNFELAGADVTLVNDGEE